MNVTAQEELRTEASQVLDLTIGELETEIPDYESARPISCMVSGYCLP